MTHRERIEQYLREGRPVSGGKGGGDKTLGAAVSEQNTFAQKLMGMFQSQFGKQAGTLNFLNSKLQGMVNNPTGLGARGVSALNSQAISNTAAQEQNAIRAANNATAGKGNGLPSGVQAQISGDIAARGQQQLSSELNSNNVLNAQVQNQQQQFGLSGEQNVASLENPLGYGSEANTGLGNVGSLDMDYIKSRQYNASVSGAGAVMGEIGQGLNLVGGVAGGIMGGIGNMSNDSTTGENVGNFFSGALGGGGN